MSSEIPCEEGVLIAVEVLNNKSRYNTIELTSGRMAEVKKGDVVVGALGHRKALFGYSGHLPTAACTRRHRAALEPRRRDRHLRFDQSLARRAVQLPRVRLRAGFSVSWANASACRRASPTEPLDHDVPARTHGVPVVALAGTCMNSGKTAAACAIVSRFRHNGLVVDAFKATGVSLRRDILAMEDAGARNTAIFTDLGVVTTTAKNSPCAHTLSAERRRDAKARRDRFRAR